MTSQVELVKIFDYEIATGFCWAGNWYLVLPKIGAFVELANLKSNQRRKVLFSKLDEKMTGDAE